jgi:hypothetical protein
VDACVHLLQAKAEHVKTDDLLAQLTEFHREKLAMRERHVAVAQAVAGYNFNNAYQYVIAREDTHLSWLEAAIADQGGTPATVPAASVSAGKDVKPLIAEDAREAKAFVDRWRPKVAALSHARNRTMLQVVLGETLEQKRFFDQMVAGNEDLLGRRANGPGSPGTGDGVMPVRWLGGM